MTREEKLRRAGKLVSEATKLVEGELSECAAWPILVALAGAASEIAKARGSNFVYEADRAEAQASLEVLP